MTPEGIVVWITGLILVPLLTGQLRQYVLKLSQEAAVILCIVVAFILAVLVQLFFGGGLHAPKDFADLVAEMTLLFGLAQAAYKLLFSNLPQRVALKLVG